jgi:hypothetical protein
MNKFLISMLCLISTLAYSNQRFEVETRKPSEEIQKNIEDQQKLENEDIYNFSDASRDLPPTYLPLGHHFIDKLSAYGDSLVLEDGSTWDIVSDQASSDVLSWRQEHPLTITQNRNWMFYSSYKYIITNEYNGSYVYANITLGPFVNSEYSYSITNINYNDGVIVLNNNIYWKTSDKKLLSEWLVKDGIIIGRNSSWGSWKQHILINTNMNNFVRAEKN